VFYSFVPCSNFIIVLTQNTLPLPRGICTCLPLSAYVLHKTCIVHFVAVYAMADLVSYGPSQVGVLLIEWLELPLAYAALAF